MIFTERLGAVMLQGNMTVSDLARWFERPDATVRSWVKGAQPRGGPLDREDIIKRLAALENLIKRRKGFPLPVRARTSWRKRYLANLLQDAL